MSRVIRDLGELHCLAECNGRYIVLGGSECGRYRLDIIENKKDYDYNIVWTMGYKSYGELKREYEYVRRNLEEYVG